LEELQAHLPSTEILRTYGQSETFRTLLGRGLGQRGLGGPITGVRARLSPDGELIHAGAGAMAGYLGETPVDPALGIATGDYFRRDERGGFHFLGRRDDLIKRQDYRVSLFEVERAVEAVPGVREAAVLHFGAPSGTGGDLVAFYLGTATEADVLARLRAELSRAKIPDAVVRLEAFPRTAVGKIDRPRLRAQFAVDEDAGSGRS
jgi:acyl-coenzyme A synthetase/AMP-(fatty) acid ligase